MLQTPVVPEVRADETHFALLAAGTAPGPELARRAAASGVDVIAMDADTTALATVVGQSPARIDGIALVGDQVARLEPLRRTWGENPMHMAVNLAPLDRSAKASGTDGQLRNLSALVRALGRGLAAGQGTVVTVVPRPAAPLALGGWGLIGAIAAANEALTGVFGPRGLRFFTVTVPEDRPELAVETVLYLGSGAGRAQRGGRIDLG